MGKPSKGILMYIVNTGVGDTNKSLDCSLCNGVEERVHSAQRMSGSDRGGCARGHCTVRKYNKICIPQ